MIFSSLPPDCELFLLPSLSARKGSERLAFAAKAVGHAEAERRARKAELYLLADDLCRKLKLEGLDLPEDGELRALSPSRWQFGLAGLPAGAEVCGLLLSPAEQKFLRAFVPNTPKPAELLSIAEHLFFEHSLKVAIRYTAPRFKPY